MREQKRTIQWKKYSKSAYLINGYRVNANLTCCVGKSQLVSCAINVASFYLIFCLFCYFDFFNCCLKCFGFCLCVLLKGFWRFFWRPSQMSTSIINYMLHCLNEKFCAPSWLPSWFLIAVPWNAINKPYLTFLILSRT